MTRDIKVALLDEVALSLRSTAEREGISATDTINRAITLYAVAAALPEGKAVKLELMDGTAIHVMHRFGE